MMKVLRHSKVEVSRRYKFVDMKERLHQTIRNEKLARQLKFKAGNGLAPEQKNSPSFRWLESAEFHLC
jgi:hypothetical protein